jgi:hypothetical protein
LFIVLPFLFNFFNTNPKISIRKRFNKKGGGGGGGLGLLIEDATLIDSI